ncbi:MAG: hypothetical protein ACOC1F_00465 [Myxococcota bacterium]
MDQSTGYPIQLVARTVHGPPTIIRFVDDTGHAVPLSQVLAEDARGVQELPTYDAIPTLDDEVEAERQTELELPRFELAGFD